MDLSRVFVLALVALAASGCFKTSEVLSSDDSSQAGSGSGGNGSNGKSNSSVSSRSGMGGTVASEPSPFPEAEPLDPDACERGGLCAELGLENVDTADLLFVIDNSESMAEEQAALVPHFPRMLARLASGDGNGDGEPDFPPAKSVHLGVISTDMGVGDTPGLANCRGMGGDGVLQTWPHKLDCDPGYPPFLSYVAGVNTTAEVAHDLQCITELGTAGCSFEQPLEAALKALWPGDDPRVTFLGTSAASMRGHGDGLNDGFLRSDPSRGVSVLAVVVLSDEDDCSSSDLEHFLPSRALDANIPRHMELLRQGPAVRCNFNAEHLFQLHRYFEAFRALRSGREDRVVFAALAGVPPETVAPEVRDHFDLSDPDSREAYFSMILNHERMQPVVDDGGTLDPEDDRMRPACESAHGSAAPALRMVELARRFGRNGIVRSICEDDYAQALDTVVDAIGANLGAACLERELARRGDGQVPCDVIWELPASAAAPQGTPVDCDDPLFPFLAQLPASALQRTKRGGARCRVAQLAVTAPGVGAGPVPTRVDGETLSEGWYYDDFSTEARAECSQWPAHRIAFSPAAKPPTGVRAVLDCAPDATR